MKKNILGTALLLLSLPCSHFFLKLPAVDHSTIAIYWVVLGLMGMIIFGTSFKIEQKNILLNITKTINLALGSFGLITGTLMSYSLIL